MYELFEDILPFVAAFYVAESFALVGRTEWLFASLGGPFRLLREGIHLATLSPAARVYSTFRPALQWRQEGVVVGREAVLVPFTALGAMVVDRYQVVLSGGVVLSTPNAAEAAVLRGRLAALRDAPAAQRRTLLSRVHDDAHDLASLRRRLAAMEKQGRRLRPLQWALCAVVFALVPWAVYGRAVVAVPLVAMVALGLPLYGATLGLGYRLLRDAGETPRNAAWALHGFLLFPPSCLHMSGLVGRQLLAGFAPLTVAGALLPRHEFRPLAREWLRRLQAERAESEFTGEIEAAQRLVEDVGLAVAEVLAAPAPTDPTAVSYCPLCSEEYRAGFESCAACQIALEPLAVPTAR